MKGSTDLTDIEHIRLYASAADGTLSVEHPLTLPMQVSEKVSFKEPLVLKDDTTLVWVTLKLKDRVNLSHRVRLACSSVKTVKGKGEVLLDGSLVDLRLGVAVRQFGQDGVNTSRIPASLLQRTEHYWLFTMHVMILRATCKVILILL